MAKGVLTNIGKEKICRALSGDGTLPIITYMVFGDGGVDGDGNVIEITGRETELKSELARMPIDKHTYPSNTTCRFTKAIQKMELAGKSISEIGLYDSENDLVAYKTFPTKSKGEDEIFVFDMDVIL